MTDEEIEIVARAMCEELGLDPNEFAPHGISDVWTPAERRDYFAGNRYAEIPDVCLFGFRWQLYRAKAAEAIAANVAIQRVKTQR